MDYVALSGVRKKRGRKPKSTIDGGPAEASKAGKRKKVLIADVTAASQTAEEEQSQDMSCKICGETFTERTRLHKHVWKHNRKRSHIW